MESIAWSAIGALGTVMAAVITAIAFTVGYYVKYHKEHFLKEKENQLKLVNKQINEVYGPLYILATVIRYSFALLILRYKYSNPEINLEQLLNEYLNKKKGYAQDDVDDIVEEIGPQHKKDGVSDWRIWMETIFAPLRIKLRILFSTRHIY